MELDLIENKIVQAERLYQTGRGPLPKFEEEREAAKKELERVKAERRHSVADQLSDKARFDLEAKNHQLLESVEVWRRQQARLNDQVEILGKEAEKIGMTSFELERMRGEIEQAEGVMKQLRGEKERLQVELQSTANRVTVNPADDPDKPDDTLRIRAAAAVRVSGSLLGLFGVAFWEAQSRRIRGKDEVVRELGLRVVGTLPALPDHPEVAPTGRRLLGRGVDPSAVWVASIDAIRALVLCHSDEESGARVLLVTSALSQEGKTTLASHLALSLARAGKRTLLIDCDSRRPRLHQVFGTPSGPGLSEALGGADPAAAVHAGPVEGLWVMPIGGDPIAVGAALARREMGEFLEHLRSRYDFILLDSCPVLPAADALVLGRLADGVLLSVRPGLSRLPHVSEACERLAALRVPVLGSVVNGTPLRARAPEYEYLAAPAELQSASLEA
jgi:capsular exopolysaccharide synthesis family protein